MSESKIEWTEQTWNVILGCDKISAGCQNCYAIQQAYRNNAMAQSLEPSKRGRLAYYEGLTEKRGNRTEWTGKIAFVEEALEIPLKRKKPTIYFVNSMGDLFHEDVTDEMLNKIFTVFRRTPQHTYQVLTKRPDRMREYIRTLSWVGRHEGYEAYQGGEGSRPLDNVWLGTSIENQKAVIDRAHPLSLINQKGWNTFYSCEPLLEEIDLDLAFFPVDWVICGAESGHGARPFDEDWARCLRDQCVAFNVPFFYKQKMVGSKKISLPELDGKSWSQSPMEAIAS